MSRIPTVRIVRPERPEEVLVINESDFDPKTMKLAEGEQEPAPPAPPAPKEPQKPQAPTDPAERIEAIAKAIETLDPENEEHWTGSGKPNVASLEAVLGWDISAAERDEAWARHEQK